MNKTTIFTLNIDNYAPEIRAITTPLLKQYAFKIGADIHEITERKFPEWPLTYEKLQIYKLAQETGSEWNIYIDSDALIHPDMFDITEQIDKKTVCHNGRDMAGHRWKYDKYFRRDGRNIGSCNWLAVASEWCLDLWHPIEDLTPQEALENIFPIVDELVSGYCEREHLIDDYALSRNIARFGLKFATVSEISQSFGYMGGLWHNYTWPTEKKVEEMKKMLMNWKMPVPEVQTASR